MHEDEEGNFGNASDHQKSKRHKVKLQGEFKMIKPPNLGGESEEATEPWLIDMNKYFQIYDYNDKLKARLEIYQIISKDNLWWE